MSEASEHEEHIVFLAGESLVPSGGTREAPAWYNIAPVIICQKREGSR